MFMVGLTRFELVTSSMSTRHSNQLSYNPIHLSSALRCLLHRFGSAPCLNDKIYYSGRSPFCQQLFEIFSRFFSRISYGATLSDPFGATSPRGGGSFSLLQMPAAARMTLAFSAAVFVSSNAARAFFAASGVSASTSSTRAPSRRRAWRKTRR